LNLLGVEPRRDHIYRFRMNDACPLSYADVRVEDDCSSCVALPGTIRDMIVVVVMIGELIVIFRTALISYLSLSDE
jgi:hypothetical protein